MRVLVRDGIDLLDICVWYEVSEDDAGNIDIQSDVDAPADGSVPQGMVDALVAWLGTEAGEAWILQQAEKQGAEIRG